MAVARILLMGVPERWALAIGELAERYAVTTLRVDGHSFPMAADDPFALVVLGAAGRGSDICERVRSVRKVLDGTPVVVLAEDIGTDRVVGLMRLGCADVVGLPKPPGDVATRALEHLADVQRRGAGQQLVGQTRSMRDLREEIQALARARSTVLITGETGTGKGHVARLIHQLSDRPDAPFIHVDCAAISPNLIESELFGHERGAFTSADSQRRGRFELARSGSVFLDEIGDLDFPLQAKLLRVLQDREYERIGGSHTLKMPARVIAATNRDLRSAIDEGSFRTDLYFRLNVFHLRVPPVRERPEDIPLLARVIVDELGERLGLRVPELSDGALARMLDYAWPGNVREIFNVLERIMVRGCADRIEAEDFDGAFERSAAVTLEPADPPPLAFDDPFPDDDGDDEPADERERVAGALRSSGGNVARAARRLGLPRSTLRYRIRRYGLQSLIPSD